MYQTDGYSASRATRRRCSRRPNLRGNRADSQLARSASRKSINDRFSAFNRASRLWSLSHLVSRFDLQRERERGREKARESNTSKRRKKKRKKTHFRDLLSFFLLPFFVSSLFLFRRRTRIGAYGLWGSGEQFLFSGGRALCYFWVNENPFVLMRRIKTSGIEQLV